MHLSIEGKRVSEVAIETKSVTYPCSDGTAVVLSEGFAGLLDSDGQKTVKAVKKRNKDGQVTRHLYVRDWLTWQVNEVVVMQPLWQAVVVNAGFDRRLPGDGRIHHDGSDSFLLGNFFREEWPEIDNSVVAAHEQNSVKTGDTPEALRVQQREWLNDETLLNKGIAGCVRMADAESSDIVQASFMAVLENINAGLCRANNKGALCEYFLSTVRNKTKEFVRYRQKNRKTHDTIDDQFEEGPLHHVKCTATTKNLSFYDKTK